MQTPVHHHTKLVLSPLRDIQPVELVMKYCLQSTIIFTSVTDNWEDHVTNMEVLSRTGQRRLA